MVFEDPAVNSLLEFDDPSIRYLILTEILDRPSDSKEVVAAKKQIPNGPTVKTLLSGQRADGGFGVHPYQKWTGAHWRLVSLVELGIPSGFRPAVKATNLVLKWLLRLILAMFPRSMDDIGDVRLKRVTRWQCVAGWVSPRTRGS
jgi:hypothetical protein